MSERSLDEAKRNPGCVSVCGAPDFASLHPGYDNCIILADDDDHNGGSYDASMMPGRLRSMIAAAPLASSSRPTARPSSRGRSAGPEREASMNRLPASSSTDAVSDICVP